MLVFITGRNEVVAKVMFLHVSVILSTGGGSRQQHPYPPGQGEPPQTRQTPPWAGRHPPGRENPPGTRQTPPAGRTPHPRTRQTPPHRENPPDQADPPPGRRLQHTVNERPVRILLECILVSEFDALVDPSFGQGTPKQVYRFSGGQFGPVECYISWSASQMFGHLPMACLTRRISKHINVLILNHCIEKPPAFYENIFKHLLLLLLLVHRIRSS